MSEAQCACGALQVKLSAAPQAVVACHCIDCQRRTGAPFGLGAYYAAGDVALSGAASEYTRPTDSGGSFTSYFCPTCGTSVYWRTSKHPSMVGVAVGAIADPTFRRPDRSVWEQSKHHWVDMTAAPAHFPRGRT